MEGLIVGTPVYQRAMAYYDARNTEEDAALQHKVWDRTPWILNVNGGSPDSDRTREIVLWCVAQFGDEAWPIHGKPGNWHRGGVTICGWTWYGFATERMMKQFQEKWGGTIDEV